jgi:hypothetical protein
MTRTFGGLYARRLRGPSRFVWTQETLGIIIRGLFQFHRGGPRLPLHKIAPHLRSLIRERVKSVVCASHGHSNFSEDHFERICARWIRLPSLGAVLLKLQECSAIASLVGSSSVTYESLRVDGFISEIIYSAFTHQISRIQDSHSGCRLPVLPAIPRPCDQPSWGSCFYCGAGLTDKIDLNLLPKCECLGELAQGEDVCVCSSCVDEIADD